MAAAAPYILLAASTAAQYKSNQDAADEKRNILNAQLMRNEDATKKAVNAVQQEAQNYAPDARQKALTDAENQAYTRSQQDLGGAGANIIDTAGQHGNVSADFLRTQADRQITEGNRLTALAREVAKTRAPSLLLTTEGQRRANLAGNLQNTFSGNQAMATAAGQDADSVTPNPYGQLAGAIGSMYAYNMAGKPGAGGGSSGGIRYSGSPYTGNMA